ncbi:MAG: hypothetical protein KDH99_01805 [Alcanivoracaceae bacterium]|nr:hypothetical protein [Alcanivoracaceae bacterium]
MPTQDDRFHPDQQLLSVFVADMLYPKVKELEAEGALLSPVKVITLSPFDEIASEAPGNPGSVCKVAFYATHNKERLALRCSVRLVRRHKESGLSGFDLRGDIKSGVARIHGFTLVYSKDEFSGIQ